MNAYLVERYLPGMSEADVRDGLSRAQAACAELAAQGSGIRYLGSIFLPLEEACFCRFDADDARTIAQALERAQLPFARITPGQAIAPDRQPTLGGT